MTFEMVRGDIPGLTRFVSLNCRDIPSSMRLRSTGARMSVQLIQTNTEEITKLHITDPLWGTSPNLGGFLSKGPLVRNTCPCQGVVMSSMMFTYLQDHTVLVIDYFTGWPLGHLNDILDDQFKANWSVNDASFVQLHPAVHYWTLLTSQH